MSASSDAVPSATTSSDLSRCLSTTCTFSGACSRSIFGPLNVSVCRHCGRSERLSTLVRRVAPPRLRRT
eukprot:1808553-Prymnesium_polylepis.1